MTGHPKGIIGILGEGDGRVVGVSIHRVKQRRGEEGQSAADSRHGTYLHEMLVDAHRSRFFVVSAGPANFSWSRPAAAFAAIRDSPRAILQPHVSVRADRSIETRQRR